MCYFSSFRNFTRLTSSCFFSTIEAVGFLCSNPVFPCVCGGYYFLRNDDFMASGAMSSGSETIFSACRCNGGIYNLCMIKCLYSFLRYNNSVTNRAMLSFGKTAFGAGGSYCIINCLSVTCCLD